ncbi:DUF4143 domain-containing protein [Rhizobium laguerreae]|uniref:DUF4143 domain-containing protein n=1 Tax=Rhizobium laguerreae TaxID=1076926 RepID=UPI0028C440A8|nr:DUF4143 domain-containing protein [Rhizobium laguerreae]
MKLASWSERHLTFSHYRTKDQDEVDVVIEDRRGRIVGIEVKASATVKSDDFKGLRQLQEAVGERFIRGLVLHDHDRVTPFGEKLHAAPFNSLVDVKTTKGAEHCAAVGWSGSAVRYLSRRSSCFLWQSIMDTAIFSYSAASCRLHICSPQEFQIDEEDLQSDLGTPAFWKLQSRRAGAARRIAPGHFGPAWYRSRRYCSERHHCSG